MTPEAERVRDAARMDIIETLVDLTGEEGDRLGAVPADMMMFCIHGLANFVRVAYDPPQMMLIIIELLADACGATAEGEITERQEDA